MKGVCGNEFLPARYPAGYMDRQTGVYIGHCRNDPYAGRCAPVGEEARVDLTNVDLWRKVEGDFLC